MCLKCLTIQYLLWGYYKRKQFATYSAIQASPTPLQFNIVIVSTKLPLVQETSVQFASIAYIELYSSYKRQVPLTLPYVVAPEPWLHTVTYQFRQIAKQAANIESSDI